MGEEWFYLLFLPVIFWCFSRDAGLRLGVVFLLNDYLNGILKDILAMPRPADPRIEVLRTENSPGFPSGHAQNAVVLWGYIAAYFRRPVLWVFAVIFPLVIGFSRIYLGVHYPHDVLGGWLVGSAFLALSLVIIKTVERLQFRPSICLLTALLVPVLLLLLAFSDDTLRDMAVLMGLGTGAVAEKKWVRFEAKGSLGRQAGRLAAGLVILFALWLGLSLLFPAAPEFRFMRYASVGLWVSLGAPWLFVRFGLARRKPE
ncbi:MAG: phosphatase PAP2 family protein [Bacillota bacterium]